MHWENGARCTCHISSTPGSRCGDHSSGHVVHIAFTHRCEVQTPAQDDFKHASNAAKAIGLSAQAGAPHMLHCMPTATAVRSNSTKTAHSLPAHSAAANGAGSQPCWQLLQLAGPPLPAGAETWPQPACTVHNSYTRDGGRIHMGANKCNCELNAHARALYMAHMHAYDLLRV